MNSNLRSGGEAAEPSAEATCDGVSIEVSIMALGAVGFLPLGGLGFAPIAKSRGMHLVSSWLIGVFSLCIFFILS